MRTVMPESWVDKEGSEVSVLCICDDETLLFYPWEQDGKTVKKCPYCGRTYTCGMTVFCDEEESWPTP